MIDNESMLKQGDFNGDGLTDFILYDGNNNFQWLINNGNFSFTITSLPTVTMLEDTSTVDNDNKDDLIVVDFNHDGKSDLIVIDVLYNHKGKYSTTYIHWYASTGTSLVLSNYHLPSEEHYYYRGYATTGDFNGDGREDIFCYNSNLAGTNSNTDRKYKIHTGFNTGFQANLVTVIKNGMNACQSIQYRPLTYSQNFYEKSLPFDSMYNIAYHMTDIQVPLYCVAHSSLAWLGNTGWSTVEDNRYSYEVLKGHTQGKGLLGFIKITTTNEGTGVIIENYSDYADAYEFCTPERQTRKVSSAGGGNLLYTQSLYQTAKSGKIITTLCEEQLEEDYGSGLSKRTAYRYDAYGNLTRQVATQGDLVQTDSIAYIQRGAWCANKPGYMRTITSYQNQKDTVVKTFDYDNRGNLLQEVLHPSHPQFKVSTVYGSYDAFGHAQTVSIKAKDKDGAERTRSTSQSYTASGRFVSSRTDVLGQVTLYQWDETRGLLLSETNPWGGVTNYTCGHWGNRLETRYPDGVRTTTVLRWAGNGAPGGTKYYSYTQRSGSAPVLVWFNGQGQEIQRDSWGLNNNKISTSTEYYTSYPNQGRVYRISEPYFENAAKTWAVTYDAYDSFGRNTSSTTPMGPTTTVYDGLTTTVTAPEGTGSTTLNASGFRESSTVNGRQVTYAYYPSGQVKTAVPDSIQSGQEITMEYDRHGNRTRLIDPDAGEIQTRYNGFGEVVEEKQKIHHPGAWNITTRNYSPSGLLQSVVRGNETLRYLYDSEAGYPARIQSLEIPGQHRQTFSYDNYSRVVNIREEIDGRSYNRGTEYDAFGRVKKEIYPTGYYTENHYDSNGLPSKITDSSNRQIWEAVQANARGQLLREKKGNRETSYTYHDRGLPEFIFAPGVIDNRYRFDGGNNLLYRDEFQVFPNQTETFSYDGQNRLNRWSRGSSVDSMVYESSTGNIRHKSDLGNYTLNYGSSGKPHALTSLSGVPSDFPSNNLSVTYTDFKKIKTLTEGEKSYLLTYGVDEHRRKSVYRENNTLRKTKYYVGDYEEEIFPDGVVRKIHYLGGAVLIQNSSGGADSLLYVYTDLLGSVTALTNEQGAVVERYAYDPWGRRRNPSNWTQADSRTGLKVTRGYTGHEHLEAFGIINMNGRVYDPLTAQFFSPDPYIQSPGEWLNYNRYSYCLNNPFKYTDPSGEIVWFVPIIIGAVIGGASYTAQVAFSDGGFNNWNWGQFGKSVGIGAISGAVTAGIGQAFGAVGSMGIGGEIARAYTHGFANEMISQFTGGDFMQGFAAGGLSSLAGSAFMMYGGSLANSPIGTYAFSGLAGGAGSALTGGNFWQGAAIGLMNAGLNHLAQLATRPSFDDLLANFPMNESGGEMPAAEVYELIGGKVLSEHQRDPNAYNNACALGVSRALNGSGVDLPNIPGKTLTGADGRNYFYRAKDLYNWMTRLYGKPNISTTDYSSLSGNKGTYIMQATKPGPNYFGAWGHATLYNMTGTIGNSYARSPYVYRFYLWNF